MVCNDIERDPAMAPWREAARRFGLRAVAAFPLEVGRRVVGALALYADEAGFFDAHERRLLEELAADTGLGLDYIDQERRLRDLAYYDPLTGLANRALFHDRLGQALARARRTQARTAVLALDLVQFRTVSDTLGRHLGDQALREVAARLTAVVRTSDTAERFGTDTVARLGGDEFALLLAEIRRTHEPEVIAHRALEAIRAPMRLEAETVVIEARAGIALGPQDGAEPEALLAHAELALHSIAAGGPEPIRYYAPEINARSRERHALEQALRAAVEREAFLLHYQPQVALADGRIVGVEALLRWHHPQRGWISPAQFVPLLEDTGLIAPVGEWVLRSACRQQRAWRETTGVGVKVAVNVSARQFHDPDLAARIGAILEQSGIEAHHLELEITESVYLGNGGRTLEALHALKALGVQVSINDFGTGYSSLGYLRKFPVDLLKIDQSFVRDLTHDPDSFLIARSVIAIAHGLGMRVIAEGVETEGQLRLLAREGCDEVQGYYFSRPVPAEALAERLQAGAAFPRPAQAPGATTTLLLVGLEPQFAGLLEGGLDPGAFRIRTAADPEEAFEALAVESARAGPGRCAVIAGESEGAEEFLRRVRAIHPDVLRIRRGSDTDPAGSDAVVAEPLPWPGDTASVLERLRELLHRHKAGGR